MGVIGAIEACTARTWLRVLLVICACWAGGPAEAVGLGHRQGTLWAPYLEWELDNPSFAGNPFDLVATATFVHAASGETRVTEMFLDGGTTWRFRFTGSRTGAWSFTTSSSDPELDGSTGTIDVAPQPNPALKGFIVADGNRFARQVGNQGALAGYLHHVFQDEVNLRTSAMWSLGLSRWADLSLTHALLDQVEENGFDTMEIELEHQVLQLDAATHTAHTSEEPDLATFRIVEAMLTLAHERGHTVRLFMWGDEARHMTPAGLPGGINGFVDRRLQRYLCARLGPLPGWTMNYGFDLEEWVTEQEVGDWAAYMTAHMGWPHLLAARMRSHPNVSLDANDERPTSGFYDIAIAELDASGNRPVVFDRRFIHLRDGVWDMETTRRALWQFTLAGGAGAVWGHEGTEYPEKEQLNTFYTFWYTHERFDLDLVRANEITDGWALRSPDGKRYVAYAENVSSLELDLSGAAEPLAVVAVDTLAGYAEVDLGVLGTVSHTLSLPHTSDWTIAASEAVTVPALSPAGLLLLATALLGSARRLHTR